MQSSPFQSQTFVCGVRCNLHVKLVNSLSNFFFFHIAKLVHFPFPYNRMLLFISHMTFYLTYIRYSKRVDLADKIWWFYLTQHQLAVFRYTYWLFSWDHRSSCKRKIPGPVWLFSDASTCNRPRPWHQNQDKPFPGTWWYHWSQEKGSDQTWSKSRQEAAGFLHHQGAWRLARPDVLCHDCLYLPHWRGQICWANTEIPTRVVKMILFLLQHSYINENSDVMKSLFLLKYQYAEGEFWWCDFLLVIVFASRFLSSWL